MADRNLLSSPIRGVVIIIATMTITYMIVAFIRLNIPNLHQIGIENQQLLQENSLKLDQLYQDLLERKSNEKTNRSSLQSETQ